MATEDKAKDIESITAKRVATDSTTEASKVSFKSPKINVTVVVIPYHNISIDGHYRCCIFLSYFFWPESPQNS